MKNYTDRKPAENNLYSATKQPAHGKPSMSKFIATDRCINAVYVSRQNNND